MVTRVEDFYFVYGYNKLKKTASRLYRRKDHMFERYNENSKTWESAPEQSRINIGEDWDYEEISEQEVENIIYKINRK